MKSVWFAAAILFAFAPVPAAPGQARDQGISVTTAGEGNRASVETGIAAGAEITGVTVINGEVWIDGERVPREASRFTGRSGKSYLIERDREGNVQVRDQ